MGVEQAAFWGAAAGLFNTIPYFGPVIVSTGLAFVGPMLAAIKSVCDHVEALHPVSRLLAE